MSTALSRLKQHFPSSSSSAPLLLGRVSSLTTSRRVQDTRASSNTRRLVPRYVFSGLAPVALLERPRAAVSVPLVSRARNPAVCEAVTPLRRSSPGVGPIERGKRALSASRRARLSSRITIARLTLRPCPPPDRRLERAEVERRRRSTSSAIMGMPAGGFDTTKVWSPAGGWFADPKYWKRNTLLGFAFLGVASATIFNYSRQVEQRPLAPTRRIPSQGWCANFPEGSPAK